MTRLQGKTALITGAANGIGRATVERFLTEGAAVFAVDRSLPTDGPWPSGLSWIEADVTDGAAMTAAAAAAVEATGRLDICIANAGVGKIENFVDGTKASWMSVIDVNLIGVMLTLQAAAREMIAKDYGGRLLATSSIAGLRGEGHAPSSAYATSKAAVMALMRALACELAQYRITANAVAPGQIETVLNFADVEIMSARSGRDPREFRTEFLDAAVPLRRMGEPSEVAALYAYLASDEAGFVTGSTFRIDGGELVI